LEDLRDQAMELGIKWVLEVDIRKFFDTLDHRHLRDLLKLRVRDGVILRLIGKWLRAGVLEDGVLVHPDAGTPQGGVISPLLANVYLHYVLTSGSTRVLPGREACSHRYADDFVIGFTGEDVHAGCWACPSVLPSTATVHRRRPGWSCSTAARGRPPRNDRPERWTLGSPLL
jgi:hypothetical protein